MSPMSNRVIASRHNDLDYGTCERLAKVGGFLRSSSSQGTSVEVWDETNDTAYVLSGEALIDFLFVVKDVLAERIHEARDLVDYIEGAAKVPPSMFMRDAIVARSRGLWKEMG